MAAASRDLQGLLAGLDPTADVAQRHIWLINLFDWLRGDRASPQAAIGRVPCCSTPSRRGPSCASACAPGGACSRKPST
jgi:hypothetical protein